MRVVLSFMHSTTVPGDLQTKNGSRRWCHDLNLRQPSTCFLPLRQLQPSFLSQSLFYLAEHLRCWPSAHLVSPQLLPPQSLRPISVSDGNRKNRPLNPHYATDDRPSHDNERRMPRGSPSGRWSNQKRLLTLFKQIETSISQEKARSTNERDSTNPSKDSNASFDSVLETLKQSGRPGIDQTLNKESDIPNHKNRIFRREKESSSPDPQPSELKATRPPSSFMKKSPIKLSSTQRTSSSEPSAGAVELPGGGVDEDPSELEKMKLTELKELAKARGIKGYSKLKKSELVNVLSH